MKKIYIFVMMSVVFMFINTSSSLVNTIIYSIAVVPIAVLLGELTSKISEFIGEKRGGLLAATVGNFPELMMGVWSISFGMIPMVKSALIGSIVSNMLLVLGISIFIGGIKFKEQIFNKIIARTNFNMLLLAMSAMVVMASLNGYSNIKINTMTSISIKVSVVLITVYILGLIFSLYTHRNLFVISEKKDDNIQKNDKLYKYILIIEIIINSVLLFVISEKLIFNIREMVNSYNLPQEFIGIILIPILGNMGENVSAIMCAAHNRVNMSLEIAIGSSIQIALFATPLLVIFSYFMGVEMTFVFSNFQIIMSGIAIGMSFFVFQDGKTYWLEGAILIAIYTMVTMGYYYLV
ncbi:calcium/proton exchanger [Clostridium ganghwense]|uniref:Ca(2+)/H(+) antiporter n=1 Tax=Clostridium ganghwense TaxID=312089 RepID=A0ABT4CM63_9CLOT|nr:calcium/proton exchanger [Clostridium ganghwense]MCY6369553.1 calcium/proton exchanger [Clostridium ganghwense]